MPRDPMEAPLDIDAMSDIDLASRTIERLARQDPELYKIFVLAAVPRSVDAELLQRLAGFSSRDEFVKSLDRLAALPYIKVLRTGLYSMHDDIRDPLLALWERDGFVGQSLVQVRAVILSCWEERYESACVDEDALDQVHGIMQSVNPKRLQQVTRAIRARMDHVLVEMVYALVAADLTDARQRFDVWFCERDDRGDYVRCELLARAFTDAVRVTTQSNSSDALNAWCKYYRFQSALSMEDFDSAASWLDSLESDSACDDKLTRWVLLGKSNLRIGQFRLVDAQHVIEHVIALNKVNHVDESNEYLAHEYRAAILERRWHVDEAVECHLSAIESASAAGNVDGAILARLALAQGTSDLGQETLQVVRAIAGARLKSPSDRVNRDCSTSGLIVLGSRSARLGALFTQQVSLLARGGGVPAEIQLLSARAEAMEKAGLARRSIVLWDEAIERANVSMPGQVPRLRANRAALLDEVGKAREAAAANLHAMNDPLTRHDVWHRARCLANAATSLLEVGDAEEAITLAEEANAEFSKIGNERAVAYTWLIRARANICLARLVEAGADLERVREPLPALQEVERRTAASRFAAASGDRERSVEHALQAYQLGRSCCNTAEVLVCGAELLVRLSQTGRLAKFKDIAEELAQLSAELHKFESWAPSGSVDAADAHAGEALRIWKAGIGDEAARATATGEHYAEALNHDDADGWIQFEAGLFALTRPSGRKAARRHFKSASDESSVGLIRDAIVLISREVLD